MLTHSGAPHGCTQEIGFAHMRAVKGMNSLLQLKALIARLCAVKTKLESSGAQRE